MTHCNNFYFLQFHIDEIIYQIFLPDRNLILYNISRINYNNITLHNTCTRYCMSFVRRDIGRSAMDITM